MLVADSPAVCRRLSSRTRNSAWTTVELHASSRDRSCLCIIFPLPSSSGHVCRSNLTWSKPLSCSCLGQTGPRSSHMTSLRRNKKRCSDVILFQESYVEQSNSTMVKVESSLDNEQFRTLWHVTAWVCPQVISTDRRIALISTRSRSVACI